MRGGARAAWARSGLQPGRGTATRIVVITAILAIVLGGLPAILSDYWIIVLTAVAIFALVALGLNVLVGRVGLVSLGQIAILALGAWVDARLSFATSLPFPVLLLVTGVITAVIGVAVGLPALRVSGLYLALITLMLAGAIAIVLNSTNFPNGGGGFLGHTESSFGNPSIRRPSGAVGDIGVLPLHGHRLRAHVPARAAGTCAAKPGGPGRRSARASPPRSPPASTSRSTSSGRSRSPRS